MLGGVTRRGSDLLTSGGGEWIQAVPRDCACHVLFLFSKGRSWARGSARLGGACARSCLHPARHTNTGRGGTRQHTVML